jgi:peptidoglycan biosynthesis protein MviN/MurJ (putative lipid II flippase)
MVFKSVGNLYILGALGAVFSFWYNLLMAQNFGTGSEVEAFFAALVVYGSMLKLSQAGYLMDILLPHYFQIRRDEGPDAAFGLISVLVNLFFLAGLAISCLFLLLSPFFFNLMVGGFDEATRAESIRFFYWIAPLMPIQVAMIAFRHLLNAEKLFARIESTSLIGSILSVATLLTMNSFLGVRVLVLNVLIIEAIQVANAAYYLRKLGYRHRFQLRSQYITMREIMLKLFSTSGYLVSVQILDFTFNNLLSNLPQGTFAVYRYCERVFRRANSLVLSPVTTVMRVVINESVTAKKASSRDTVGKAVHFGLLASLGFLFTFLVCGNEIVPFLFRGDRFPLAQVAQSRILLTMLFAGTVMTVVDIVYQNTYIALGKGKTHFILRIGHNLVSVLLAVWLIGRWDFDGLLAFRIVSPALALAISIGLVWVREKEYLAPLFSWYTLRILAATSVGLAVLVPLSPYLRPLGDTGAFAHLVNATIQASLYCLITYPLARWMRISEIVIIEEKVRNVAARMRKGKTA